MFAVSCPPNCDALSLKIMNCHDLFLPEAALVSNFVIAIFTRIKMRGMGYLIQIKKTVGPDSPDSDEYGSLCLHEFFF